MKNLVGYLMDIDNLDSNATIQTMTRALLRGNLSGALAAMRSWIDGIPYDIITQKERMAKKDKEDFYKLLIYTVFNLLNSKVDTEVKSIRGRADVVIQTQHHVYVLELKVGKSVDEALTQIDSVGYAIQYEAIGRTVYKISSEKRNVVHWKKVDERGE